MISVYSQNYLVDDKTGQMLSCPSTSLPSNLAVALALTSLGTGVTLLWFLETLTFPPRAQARASLLHTGHTWPFYRSPQSTASQTPEPLTTS